MMRHGSIFNRRMKWPACMIVLCLLPNLARAAIPNLAACDGSEFEAQNGSIERVTIDNRPAIRWHINTGQTSTLTLRRDHPLFDRLRYYDRLQFEFRIVS